MSLSNREIARFIFSNIIKENERHAQCVNNVMDEFFVKDKWRYHVCHGFSVSGIAGTVH